MPLAASMAEPPPKRDDDIGLEGAHGGDAAHDGIHIGSGSTSA